MIEEVNRRYPVARKQHKCNFCGGTIEKGEKYDCCTISFDGSIYTWKSHLYCSALTAEMDGYETDEGLDEDDFKRWIDDYVREHHFDSILDDISVEWQDKSTCELAKMIYEEIKNEL